MANHFKMPPTLNERVVDMVHEVEAKGKFFSVDEVKDLFRLSANQGTWL